MPRTPHWLRTNRAARMPRRVVCLDSEAYRNFDGVSERQRFRLAVASFDRLDNDGNPTGNTDWLTTDDTQELWRWIVDRTAASHRTVLFAHNLAYDLRISDCLRILPWLGFQLRSMSLSDYGTWANFSDGKRSLALVDSLSHIPVSLDRIATALNRQKLDLPDDNDSYEAWAARCAVDVRILREAVIRLLSLYRRHDCGDFRQTGAAQASAAFRHRFLSPKTLLVHDNLAALAMERESCYAGRTEVWRHGEHKGPLYEFDYPSAYATVARDTLLPIRLRGEYFPSSYDDVDRLSNNYCVLCEVDIATDIPVLPTLHDGRVVWPVGRFRSALWDVELRAGMVHGARLSIRNAYVYDRAPLLREWALWILSSLNGFELGADPIGKIVAKDWSRSLIGRFGLRYSQLDKQGTVDYDDLVLRPVYDENEGRHYRQLHLGSELFEESARVESDNSTPAVMSYVMAASRVRIWDAMCAAGLGNVIYVDTDGLILDDVGATALEHSGLIDQYSGLRVKGIYKRGTFTAPRNIELEDMRRVNGVPRNASRLAPCVYRGEVWESLRTALRHRRAQEVRVHERVFTIDPTDHRRQHVAGGRTEAFTLG